MKEQNRKIIAFALALAALAYAEPSFAQTFSSAQSVGNAIASFLTGPMARSIGAIAFAAFGIASFAGRIDWRWGAAICVGLVAIFGGAAFVSEFETLAS